MNPIVIILGTLFTFISCAILAYTSIASTMGPWIAPTIVLASILISKILCQLKFKTLTTKDIILIQGIASGGGIIATGIGFALPMIYFLDPESFHKWMNHPFYFFYLIGAICIASGSLGLCIGRILSKFFIDKNVLPYPVSHLTYNIATTDQRKQTKCLFVGVISTLILLILRDGIGPWNGILPKVVYLLPCLFGQELAFSVMPMFWAIGSTMGMTVIIPFLIGMISKYIILYPLNYHSKHLPFTLFQPYNNLVLIFAFCSGILIYEVFYLVPRPSTIKFNQFNDWIGPKISFLFSILDKQKIKILYDKPNLSLMAKIIMFLEPAITLCFSFALLSYFLFSIPAQITLLIFTIIATYQICLICGEIGLLQLGRFATLVMLPMYLIFKLNFVQITISCVFFNICAATASDFLFDYRTGLMCGITKKQMHKYQILGLIISASCLGVFFWLLFTNLQIGSPELFAQRAQNNAALLQAIKFDPIIVTAGFLFAFILKSLKISPAMTFGGIIMPNSITLSLLLGSFAPMFFKNKTHLQFLSAGAFSSESIWIFACIIGKILSS